MEEYADATVTVLNYIPVPNGTEHDGKVLSFCYKRARKVAEIAAYLGMSDSTYLRNQVLENLTNPEMVDEN